MITYVANEFVNGDVVLFVNKIKEHLSKELGDVAMTIAQQLRNEGIQRGVQRGMQHEKHNIAKRMLRRGADIQTILEDTGLGLTEIKELKKELEETLH